MPSTVVDETNPCHPEDKTTKKICIDDLTILEYVNLKESLKSVSPDFIGLLEYEQSGLFHKIIMKMTDVAYGFHTTYFLHLWCLGLALARRVMNVLMSRPELLDPPVR